MMDSTTAKMLESLAAKLGTTTEYLWRILIRQAAVDVWSDVILYTITVAIVITAILAIRWLMRVADRDDDSFMPILIIGFVALIFVVWSAFTIDDTITKLVNPEYYALEKVLSAVK